MNQPSFQGNSSIEFTTSTGLKIDYKRILYRILRYWYVVALSLVIALTIAFFKNRYATRIYSVTASILIKETEDVSEGKLLYNNPLVSFHRNYLNEIYIIRSYPLIEKTLKDLNFGVSFYQEGNVLTSEAYEYLPIEAHVVNDFDGLSGSFYFKILNGTQFQLAEISDDEKELNKRSFAFGDTITYGGLEIVFSKLPNFSRNEFPKDDFIFSYTPVKYLTDGYVGSLSASWAEEGAGVINLGITGPTPAKAKDFMAGLINQYQAFDLDKKNQTASRTIDFINDQLKGITDSLTRAENRLERFKDKNAVISMSDQADRLYKKLETIEKEKADYFIRKNYYDYLTTYIAGDKNLDQVILPSSVGIDDPILVALASKMLDLQLQIRMMGKESNPLVNESKRKIGEIKRDIQEAVFNQATTDKIKMGYIDRQLAEVERQLGKLPLAERQLVAIQRNYSLLETLYIFLLQKRAEAGISRASTTTDIAIVNPPASGGPIAPVPSNNYLIALIVGLGLPIGLFLLIEISNNLVQSREDVEKITNIPFIGGLGHKRTTNNLEVIASPKSPIAESFRALRSNLNYFIEGKTKAVFMVTSSISGEGKTFASINLASVFALSGRKTLIVGADLRKPKIYSDFALSNDVGLSTYLAGLNDFDSVIQRTSYESLDLISGGPVPPNPSELLLTHKMSRFIEEAKERYDYIIIDTPPLALVTDAFVMADHADHILFMVRQNFTPKSLLINIHDFYATGKIKHISIVLNDIYKSGPGYGYGYGYEYGYGYGYGLRSNGKKKHHGHGYYSED